MEADKIDKETEKKEVEKKDKQEIDRLKHKEKEKEKEKQEQDKEEKYQEEKDEGVGAEVKKPDRKDRDDGRKSYGEKREDRRKSARGGKKEPVKEEVKEVIPEVKEVSTTKRLGKNPDVLRNIWVLFIWVLLWFMGNLERYRDMVLNDMFVDDLVTGGKLTEVLRVMMDRDKDTGK